MILKNAPFAGSIFACSILLIGLLKLKIQTGECYFGDVGIRRPIRIQLFYLDIQDQLGNLVGIVYLTVLYNNNSINVRGDIGVAALDVQCFLDGIRIGIVDVFRLYRYGYILCGVKQYDAAVCYRLCFCTVTFVETDGISSEVFGLFKFVSVFCNRIQVLFQFTMLKETGLIQLRLPMKLFLFQLEKTST